MTELDPFCRMLPEKLMMMDNEQNNSNIKSKQN
jgi:hypothetical protein